MIRPAPSSPELATHSARPCCMLPHISITEFFFCVSCITLFLKEKTNRLYNTWKIYTCVLRATHVPNHSPSTISPKVPDPSTRTRRISVLGMM